MTYWRLFYHLVWGVKQRLPLITPEVEALIFPDVVSKATELGAIVYALNGTEDHVHLVAAIPPRIAVADFIGAVKGRSSHLVRQQINPDFAWQSGYGVHSFAEKHLSKVRAYVERQKEHHANNTLNMTLEARQDDNDGPPLVTPD